MPPRKLRGTLALVVLGLLAEEPLHPYAMVARMRERGHDRLLRLRPASVYDAVARLASAELISAGASERHGGRPERTAYAITERGRDALREWLADALVDPDSGELPIALSFMFALGRDRAIDLLERRAGALADAERVAAAALAAAERDGVPPIFLSEQRYASALRRAEQAWVDDFLAQVRTGALAWPAAAGEHGAAS